MARRVIVEVDVAAESEPTTIASFGALAYLLVWFVVRHADGSARVRFRGDAATIERVLRGTWNPTLTVPEFEELVVEELAA